MELKEAVKNLPKQPGVYLMKDKAGTIIYVGKAKNLKARVSQYFHKNKNNSPKVNEMVENISKFDYITVDTELDAFLLECKTIKELQPRYNRLMKNYKNYKYIKLTVNEDYPKFSVVPQPQKDGALYFGPFTSQGCVENAIEFIKDAFPIRKCGGSAAKKSSSGCLHFHLGNCLGPCTGNDLQKEYKNEIDKIVNLLEGKDNQPIRELQAQMKLASSNLEFEKAAVLRDRMRGIRHVLNKQRIIKISSVGRNILAAQKYDESQVKIFLIKGNKLLSAELFNLSENNEDSLEDKLKSLILNGLAISPRAKENNLSQEEIDEAQIIYSYLRNKSNGIWSTKIPISRINSLNYKKIIENLYQMLRMDS